MKLAVLLCALAGTSFCREFIVSTPKGNLVVNVKSNSLELGSFFKMQGTITNTTDWNFKYLRLTIRFYGPNGNEWAALCPTDGYSCETLGISIPAHRTIDFDTGPGVHFSMEPMNSPVKTRRSRTTVFRSKKPCMIFSTASPCSSRCQVTPWRSRILR